MREHEHPTAGQGHTGVLLEQALNQAGALLGHSLSAQHEGVQQFLASSSVRQIEIDGPDGTRSIIMFLGPLLHDELLRRQSETEVAEVAAGGGKIGARTLGSDSHDSTLPRGLYCTNNTAPQSPCF